MSVLWGWVICPTCHCSFLGPRGAAWDCEECMAEKAKEPKPNGTGTKPDKEEE